jgi:hypothetical protein
MLAKAPFPTLLPQFFLPAEGSDWKLHFSTATEVKIYTTIIVLNSLFAFNK